MAGLADILFGNFAQAKRDELATAGAQAIFQQVGQPGQTATANQGIGPLREIAPTGINALPPGDQQAAFASIVAQTPGFEKGGITLFSAALQNRAQRVQQAEQFQTGETRLTGQFDQRLEQDHEQWEAEQIMRQAKRGEEAAFHVQKMLLSDAQLEAAQASITSAAQASEIAVAKFQRLTPADQVLVQTSANNLFSMQDNINLYEDGFAVNSVLDVVGKLELVTLAAKNNKSVFELNKTKFWSDIEEYEQYFGQALSGADISDTQREAIRRIIPNTTDDDAVIQQKMRALHKETARILTSIQSRLTVEGFRDIGSQFEAGLVLPALPGSTVEPPPPPGFN